MNKIYTLFALLLSSSLLMGQITIVADVNPIFTEGTVDSFEVVGKIDVMNTGSSTTTFTWVRDESNLQDGWVSSVCDKNRCWFSGISSESFELAPGETSDMDFHLMPLDICGEGFGIITLTDDNNAANLIEIRYDILINNSDGSPCETSISTIITDVNPASAIGMQNEFGIIANVNVTNNGTDASTFTWVRDESNLVDGWESYVQDKNIEWFPPVNSQSLELAAGESSSLDLVINPNNICGEGFGILTLTDDNDSNNFVEIRYEFTVNTIDGSECESSTSVTEFKLDFIQVYPNPAHDFFTLTDTPADLEIIHVYNILGTKVRSFNAENSNDYNISDLNQGLYLINLINSKGENLNTIKLHKE